MYNKEYFILFYFTPTAGHASLPRNEKGKAIPPRKPGAGWRTIHTDENFMEVSQENRYTIYSFIVNVSDIMIPSRLNACLPYRIWIITGPSPVIFEKY